MRYDVMTRNEPGGFIFFIRLKFEFSNYFPFPDVQHRGRFWVPGSNLIASYNE